MHYFDFHYSWEQRKVREVTDRYDNLRIPVAASLRVAGTTPYYGANGIQDYVDGYTHDGEFILVAEDGANDLKNYPVKCVKGRIWVNNHAHVLQGKYDCADNQFLAYAISQADIESLLVGGGRAKLNAETLMGIDLLLPNKAEQIRIGKYLAQLDNLITLHQRKYDKLTNVKKSMLEKMFPQNGSNVPEIRFKGFTEAWEQRKLGDVVDVRSGKDYKHLSEGNIPVYGTGGFMLSVNQALSYDEDAIGIGRKGTIDKPYILKAPFWTVDTLFYAIPREKVDLNFAFDVFQNIDWKKKDESTGVPSLSKTAINEIDVLVPQYDEQQPLGQFFNRIDNLITLHQCKCQIDGCRFQSPLAITWEQRKVREVTDRYDNLRIPVAASLRVAGTTPYYGANGIQDYVDGYTHDGEFILVAEDGANDLKNYPVKCVKGRIWVNNHAHVLQGKYDCADNQFLAYAISQADIESLLVGGGRAKLNAETLMGIDLLLPNKAEQIRIGKYLAQLDNLITLHQRKPVVVNSSSTMNALPNQHLYFQVLE